MARKGEPDRTVSAHMRRDKRFHDGESVTRRVLRTSGLIDLRQAAHGGSASAPLSDISVAHTIPTTTLHAAPLLADWIAEHVEEPLIVGPDEKASNGPGAIASASARRTLVLRKTRHGDRSVDIEVPDLSIWRGRTPVLVDDIASSGRTLAVGRTSSPSKGMRKPECVVVHACSPRDAWALLTPLFCPNHIHRRSTASEQPDWSAVPTRFSAGKPIREADLLSIQLFQGPEMPSQANLATDWRAG